MGVQHNSSIFLLFSINAQNYTMVLNMLTTYAYEK